MSEEEVKALIEMNHMLKYQNEKLLKDLQVYIKKEEKIRECCKNVKIYINIKEILIILNEKNNNDNSN